MTSLYHTDEVAPLLYLPVNRFLTLTPMPILVSLPLPVSQRSHIGKYFYEKVFRNMVRYSQTSSSCTLILPHFHHTPILVTTTLLIISHLFQMSSVLWQVTFLILPYTGESHGYNNIHLTPLLYMQCCGDTSELYDVGTPGHFGWSEVILAKAKKNRKDNIFWHRGW